MLSAQSKTKSSMNNCILKINYFLPQNTEHAYMYMYKTKSKTKT